MVVGEKTFVCHVSLSICVIVINKKLYIITLWCTQYFKQIKEHVFTEVIH